MNRLVARVQPFAGMRHLDVAGGTGDVAFRILRAIRDDQIRQQEQEEGSAGPESVPLGEVNVCDINPAMLREGQKKARSQGLGKEDPLKLNAILENDTSRLWIQFTNSMHIECIAP